MKIFTIALLVLAIGCGGDGTMGDSGKAQIAEMKTTEANQQRLMQAQKPPHMTSSLERKQLIARLEMFNDENKISYITLMSLGRPVGYFAVKGKVSSVNSLLTSPDQVLHTRNDKGGAGAGYTRHSDVVASPDLDGSYGSNGDAVFFFLQDGTYMEWNGEYLLSTRPVRLSIEPIIMQDND